MMTAPSSGRVVSDYNTIASSRLPVVVPHPPLGTLHPVLSHFSILLSHEMLPEIYVESFIIIQSDSLLFPNTKKVRTQELIFDS